MSGAKNLKLNQSKCWGAEGTMKRREFCSVVGGSIVASKAQNLLAALNRDASAPSSAAARSINSSSELGLENETVRIAFDAQTGELVSLKNVVRGDEYLKDRAHNGGPFRIFSDFHGDFDVSATGSRYVASVDPAEIAGSIIDPLKCRLVSRSFRRTLTGLALELTYEDTTRRWRADLEVWLPDQGNASEWNLGISNISPVATVQMAAFPDISGFRLGQNGSTNLQTALREGGRVIPAWSGGGGVYGNGGMISMQWHALFDRKMGEYLGLIVQDGEIRNKWFRFPKPRIQVVYFPGETLAPGQSWKAPTTQLIIGTGDWKPVARAYSAWFGEAFKMVETPEWVKALDGWHGVWFAKIGGPKPGGGNSLAHPLESFTELPEIYREQPVDMHEYAFYSEGAALHNVHADGDYILRSDLGGAPALKKGIEAIHRLGFRFTFYIEGYIVHETSDLAKSGKAQRWSVMHKDGTITGPYTKEGFYHMCPGCTEWQDHLAEVASRLVRETGADGVRLDSLGFYFLSCYNPAHQHDTPFGYNQWIQQLLDKVSRAVRAVNPECVLTTEAGVDFYSQWFHGALLQTYPRDLPPVRLALPAYRLFVYSQGGPVFGSLSGLPGGSNGYPNLTEWRQLDENWRSMRQGVGKTLVWGEVPDRDPQASLPDVTCRLFYGPEYSVVVGARAASDDPSHFPANVGISNKREPFTVRVKGVDGPLAGAYLYDIEKATVTPFKVRKEGADWILPVENTNWFMVLLRPPLGPAIGSFSAVRPLHAGESAEVDLALLAPAKGKAKVQATLASRGLRFGLGSEPSVSVSLPSKATLVVPAGTPPGRYEVELKGENLVGIKRFVVVE
jgi:Domain of unknown function (DUF6259)